MLIFPEMDSNHRYEGQNLACCHCTKEEESTVKEGQSPRDPFRSHHTDHAIRR